MILFLLLSLAHAGGRLTDARFSSCAGAACVRIRASEAYEGTLRDGTYFKDALVLIGTRELRAASVYYDIEANELQFRGLGGSSDAFMDLRDGQLHRVAF